MRSMSGRRRVIHVAVTHHPTAAWMVQQLRGSISVEFDAALSFTDHDLAFQAAVGRAKAMGVEDVRTALRSPWKNAYLKNDSSAPSAVSVSITSSCSTPWGCAPF
jgi:hypothetical protein